MNYITIPGFEDLTQQQMFDMSLAHIRKTRVKSYGKVEATDGYGPHLVDSCKYSGSGCNAAPFIREECRAEADCANGPFSPCWRGLYDKGRVPKHEVLFVTQLQQVHDDCDINRFMVEYEKAMEAFAINHNLVYTPEA